MQNFFPTIDDTVFDKEGDRVAQIIRAVQRRAIQQGAAVFQGDAVSYFRFCSFALFEYFILEATGEFYNPRLALVGFEEGLGVSIVLLGNGEFPVRLPVLQFKIVIGEGFFNFRVSQ